MGNNETRVIESDDIEQKLEKCEILQKISTFTIT